MDFSLIENKQKNIDDDLNKENCNNFLNSKIVHSELNLEIKENYQPEFPQAPFNPKQEFEQLNQNDTSTNYQQQLIHLSTINNNNNNTKNNNNNNNNNTNEANTSIGADHFSNEYQLEQADSNWHQIQLPDFLSSSVFTAKSIKLNSDSRNPNKNYQITATYDPTTLSQSVDKSKSSLPLYETLSPDQSYLMNDTNNVQSCEGVFYTTIINYPEINHHPNSTSNHHQAFHHLQQCEQNQYFFLNNSTALSQSVDQSNNYYNTITGTETSIRQFYPVTNIKNYYRNVSTINSNNNKLESQNGCQRVFGTFTASGEKIRRPPNAFMIFAKDRRREILYSNQKMTNKDVSKQLGSEWHNLSLDEKNHYKYLSEQLRFEHQLKYPGYYYSPVEARRRKEEKRLKKIDREDEIKAGKSCRKRDTSQQIIFNNLTNNHCTGNNARGHCFVPVTLLRSNSNPTSSEISK